MKKAGSLLIIYALVVLTYVVMAVLQPFTNQIINTVNTSVNWTNYPATQAVLVGWPFWAYLVPGSVALIATVMILKSDLRSE